MRCSLYLAMALALGGGIIAAAPDVAAQSRSEVRKTAEGSMVLTGQINIGTEGQVEGFVLDQREKVAADLASFVDRSVQTWRFEPIVRDGKPVRARTQVSIRLLANAGPDGRDRVTLDAANFGTYDNASTDQVTSVKLQPPMFPSVAADMGGRGEVILIVQVGRDGEVMDVIAEQVNLRVLGDERRMQKLREVFARYSVKAARSWTFRAPTTGDEKDAPFWSVRVPVNFDYTDQERGIGYGQWRVYIPGPRAQAAWRSLEQREKDTHGPLAYGGVYMADVNNGPRLLTPLGG